jgi:hypothetical protein
MIRMNATTINNSISENPFCPCIECSFSLKALPATGPEV